MSVSILQIPSGKTTDHHITGENAGSLETDGSEPVEFGANLQKGIYIMRVFDGKKVTMKRLVKE